MFFDQFMQQPNNPAALSGALGGAGGNLGSLANLIMMGGGGAGAVSGAPALPQPGAVPQSAPMGGAIPPVPQPQQGNILQMLMQMNPEQLRQMLSGMGGMGAQTRGMPGRQGLIPQTALVGEGGRY